MGILWRAVAPLGVVEVRADGLYRAGGEGDEASIAAGGWFLLLGLAVGIVVAALVYLRWRPLDFSMLFGLALGGLLGSVIAWRLGMLLGPRAIETTARGLKGGSRFDGPLTLPLMGALVAWPLASVIASFGLVAGVSDDAPGPDAAPWLRPDAGHGSGSAQGPGSAGELGAAQGPAGSDPYARLATPWQQVSHVSPISPFSPAEPPPPSDPC